jgi:hypothetical protein
MLNQRRLAKAREALEFARKLRTGAIPIVQWRGWAAQALSVAGEERRSARQPWDCTVTIWVCPCCMLTHANGECRADDSHGGDFLEPLGSIRPEDALALGLAEDEHHEQCTPRDRENGCDCEVNPFSHLQCDGCGSFLAGERHAMTLFVGEYAAKAA